MIIKIEAKNLLLFFYVININNCKLIKCFYLLELVELVNGRMIIGLEVTVV